MKRKILIGLGGLTSLVTPIAALSCACSSKSNNDATEIDSSIQKANKSPLTIADSNLLFDITASKDGPFVLEESKKLNHAFDSIKWADKTYEIEKRIILDWFKDQVEKLNSIKVAFVSYDEGIKWVRVYRFDTELSRFKELSPISTIYDLYSIAVETTQNIPTNLQDVVKRSTDISDFYNNGW